MQRGITTLVPSRSCLTQPARRGATEDGDEEAAADVDADADGDTEVEGLGATATGSGGRSFSGATESALVPDEPDSLDGAAAVDPRKWLP